MKCKKCGEEAKIVNKFFCLCKKCNNIRLYGNAFGKKYDFKKSKPRKISSNKNVKINKDEEFYLKCFNQSNHVCEECGVELPNYFRDANNKVVARYQYSHIVPKSIAPNLRYDINNVNILCLKCHQKWENGDKKSMKIYEKNKIAFPNFFDK